MLILFPFFNTVKVKNTVYYLFLTFKYGHKKYTMYLFSLTFLNN